DRRRVRIAGAVRLRRHARAVSGVPFGTVPDRGPRDGGWLLLSSGRDLGWPDRAVARRLRDVASDFAVGADPGHHGRLPGDLRHPGIPEPGKPRAKNGGPSPRSLSAPPAQT